MTEEDDILFLNGQIEGLNKDIKAMQKQISNHLIVLRIFKKELKHLQKNKK